MDISENSQTTGSEARSGHPPIEATDKKDWETPNLTPYGNMGDLTRLGGGEADNDGDDEYGSPS